jgi:hypothetical protein
MKKNEDAPHTSREHKKATYLVGVHNDGSFFLKAADVGSVASQEAAQHVQAR